MTTINPVQTAVTQVPVSRGNNKKNIYHSSITESSCDSVCFKGNPSKKLFTTLKRILGITTVGATGVAATKIATEEIKNSPEVITDEWNTECKGYKVLANAGFSDELINKTIDKMEKSEVDSLKKGFDKVYIKDGEGTDGIISRIYNELNKDLHDEEKSAEVTFKLLSEILKRSKEDRIYLYGVYASIKFEGAKVFEKGTLDNGGIFGNNFTFHDKDGHNLGAARIKERIDSEGNKIVEKVDCDGYVSKDGKKYDKNGRLLEEWDEFTRTKFHYDEDGRLFEKVKYMANAKETLKLVNGEWKSDKAGGWKDW